MPKPMMLWSQIGDVRVIMPAIARFVFFLLLLIPSTMVQVSARFGPGRHHCHL